MFQDSETRLFLILRGPGVQLLLFEFILIAFIVDENGTATVFSV